MKKASVLGLAFCLGLLFAVAQALDFTVIFSEKADFDKGTYFGTHATNGYLELTDLSETNRYLWVANAAESSVSKVDTIMHKEVARYYTGPGRSAGGHSPSRTAVDSYGNVWVGNRLGAKNAVKIAGHDSYCIDRNNNGMLDTSYDQNSNGIIDLNEILDFPDECVLTWSEQLSFGQGTGPRAVAIDLDGYVWIGTYESKVFAKLNPDTGSVILRVGVNGNPYGAAVDGNGILWSSNRGGNTISWINTQTDSKLGDVAASWSTIYGMSVDTHSRVWYSLGWGSHSGGVIQVNAANPSQQKRHSFGSISRGVTIDGDGFVWVADSGNHRVYKMQPSSSQYGAELIPMCTCNDVGSTPIGVVVDSQGYIWAMAQGSNRATKINPDDCSKITHVQVGKGPYTYSDATGSVLSQFVRQRGTWTVTIQKTDLYRWDRISWSEWDNKGDNVIVEVRKPADLEFTRVQNGQQFEFFSNDLVIRVTLIRNEDGTSPKIDDIVVSAFGPIVCGDGQHVPPVEECDDGNAENSDACIIDIPGDYACRQAICGDAYLWGIDCGPDCEECDDGLLNSDTIADRCRENCRLPACGDNVKDTGEECDGSSASGCDTGMCFPKGHALECVCMPWCGNGIVEDWRGEECDTGQTDNCATHACYQMGHANECTCIPGPFCGNTLVEGFEECDTDGSVCSSGVCYGAGTDNPCTCAPDSEKCGNSIIDAGEECEADSDCTAPAICLQPGVGGGCTCYLGDGPPGNGFCGDGTIGAGEECEESRTAACPSHTCYPPGSPKECDCVPVCYQDTVTLLKNQGAEYINLQPYMDIIWPTEVITDVAHTDPGLVDIDVQDVNAINVQPLTDVVGTDEVNVTMQAQHSGKVCFTFDIRPVPAYKTLPEPRTRVLIGEDSLVSSYHELGSEVNLIGPYVITVKTWEKK